MKPSVYARVAAITLTSFVSPAAFAQNGDRAGEVQAPPPSHLKSPPAPVLSAAEAARSFQLPPGFRIELVASEPLVFDPVAMAFGPDGRLWVVEMRAYMPNVDGTGEHAPIGTIAVLEDVDGDGRMDKRTEFAGGLVMPRAIALVGKGVLVAEPPNLWFFEDANRDGKADKRTQVASDYGDTTNPEHTANGLMPALDNWIYSANHTTRFRYDNGQWRREPTVFRGQWGITQDDVGRLYHNNNSEPLRMDVLPAEYLMRNPNLVAPDSVNFQLAKASDTPVWPGRITLGVNRGYKILRGDGTLPELTAACGPVIYRGNRFPREFHGDAFVAEPSANLIKRLRVVSEGPVPSVTNAYSRAEFLTSTDERFRPVNLYNGPDGSLYVVDMYRGIIQHRIYLTTYLRNQIQERGLEAPVGLGRIWRITTGPAQRSRADLAKASTRKLVELLMSEQSWSRDMAQRLLVDRRDPSAVSLLRQRVSSANKLGRLHALWTLEGLSAVDWATVKAALDDAEVDVAIAGIRLSERLAGSDAAAAIGAIAARIKAGEPGFLRQAALSLGAAPPEKADGLLDELALRHGALPFMADALVSSWKGREAAALQRLADGSANARPVIASLAAAILKSGDAGRIEALLSRLNAKDGGQELTDAILEGVERFIPGEGARRRTAFLPQEPIALATFARGSGAQASRAADLLRFLRWRGQQIDESTALASLSEAERKRFERGREEFKLCAACHQPQGQGQPGLAPPLVGSPWVNGGTGAAIRIVLQGKTSGETTMPPLSALDDEQIAAILTYVRRSWGHEASPVTGGDVRAVRSETKLREEPWSEADLASFN